MHNFIAVLLTSMIVRSECLSQANTCELAQQRKATFMFEEIAATITKTIPMRRRGTPKGMANGELT